MSIYDEYNKCSISRMKIDERTAASSHIDHNKCSTFHKLYMEIDRFS